MRKLEKCRYVSERRVTHPDLMRNFGRNKTLEVETANLNVLTISSHRVSSFPLCYSKTTQYQVFVELCWTFYPLLLNVPLFMYSGCDLLSGQDLRFLMEGPFAPASSPPGWPAPSPLAWQKGWLTFVKYDFALWLCVRSDTPDRVLSPSHPRHRHVHFKVRFGGRNCGGERSNRSTSVLIHPEFRLAGAGETLASEAVSVICDLWGVTENVTLPVFERFTAAGCDIDEFEWKCRRKRGKWKMKEWWNQTNANLLQQNTKHFSWI